MADLNERDAKLVRYLSEAFRAAGESQTGQLGPGCKSQAKQLGSNDQSLALVVNRS